MPCILVGKIKRLPEEVLTDSIHYINTGRVLSVLTPTAVYPQLEGLCGNMLKCTGLLAAVIYRKRKLQTSVQQVVASFHNIKVLLMSGDSVLSSHKQQSQSLTAQQRSRVEL